jgi:hypothetical protein
MTGNQIWKDCRFDFLNPLFGGQGAFAKVLALDWEPCAFGSLAMNFPSRH